MTVIEINVHEHQVKMDKFEHYAGFIKTTIQSTLVNAVLDVVDVFNLKGEATEIKTGNKKRLVVLGNHPQVTEGSIEIVAVDGSVLAQYVESGNEVQQLNIFSDVFGTFDDASKELFVHIMKEVNRLVFYQRMIDFSWKHTSKKEELTAKFTKTIKIAQEKYLEEDMRKITQFENDIRDYTRSLKQIYDKRIRTINQIETAKAKLDVVDGKLIKDLDTIITHPKVKDLYIKDDKFIVETTPIHAYHDKTGEQYYIGNMRIEMKPEVADVKFFGDNPRKSYWSERDPHPHVDGRNGNACLGNISSAIAELCSQMELYALTMICIDFLESVNTDDSAGKNIKHWDKVGEKKSKPVFTNTTPPDIPASVDTWTCDHCDEPHDDDEESYQVYTSYTGGTDGEGEWGIEQFVCEECRSNYYTFHDELDAFVHDGACDIIEDDEEDEEDEF